MVEIRINPIIGPRLLETITSALYEDPIIIFREYVQNSVDAYNWAIDVDNLQRIEDFFVNIRIDREKRYIKILDNGYGIAKEKFLNEMTTIGSSKKSKLKDQIGFRGIGRLSAMPSCQRLVFTNKPKKSNEIQIFTWNGEEFNNLLNLGEEPDFVKMINAIADLSTDTYKGNDNDSFFKVEIFGYKDAIPELIEDPEFENKLCLVLPLKYSKEFKSQNKIKDEYEKYMRQSLDKFSFNVKYNNKRLYKPYTDEDILESGIAFWHLQYPEREKGVPGEKIGILWFSFDKKVKGRKDKIHGIYVRSKNMLMGDQYSIATDVSRSKTEYVTTLRELTQALTGVTGEMLIHSEKLNDNARRDWFRIDEHSIPLRHIIADFMRRLNTYRYVASRYFRDTKDKPKFIKAYSELTHFDPAKVVSDINTIKDEIRASKELFKFADEDIPIFPITLKRFYDRLIKCLYEYYRNEKKLVEFIKMRAHIKKYLNKEQ